MDIIVHSPKSEGSRSALPNKVSEIHVAAISHYLQKLNCSKEQKIAFLKMIQKEKIR